MDLTKLDEYQTIREEMLQRFRWTFEIFLFAIVSTSAIVTWLAAADQETNQLFKPDYIFVIVIVGLGIIAFIFWYYRNILRGIYSQGSFLVVFHELENPDLKWHLLSRFRYELTGGKLKWGNDGRNAAWLLMVLYLVNISAPIVIWQNRSLPDNLAGWILFLIIVLLSIFIFKIWLDLLNTRKFMHNDMKNWLDLKNNKFNIIKNGELLKKELEKILEK